MQVAAEGRARTILENILYKVLFGTVLCGHMGLFDGQDRD